MGKKVGREGKVAGGLRLPVSSDLKVRCHGVRIKHRLGPNSLKLYDKAYDELGAVLRAELTISQPKYFHVYRRTDDPNSTLAWPKHSRHAPSGSSLTAGLESILLRSRRRG